MYQGESGKNYLYIKDESGAAVSPLSFDNIEVRLVNSMTGALMRKYSKEAQTDFTPLSVTDSVVVFYFANTDTAQFPTGSLDVEVSLIINDNSFPGGKNVTKFKAELTQLNPANNG